MLKRAVSPDVLYNDFKCGTFITWVEFRHWKVGELMPLCNSGAGDILNYK
jgi:hypothetical protein